MKKQHTYHQHYVPKFLLQYFSFNSKSVYVLDRERGNKIFRQKVDNICYTNDLYEEKWKNNADILGKYVLDNKLEKYFSEIETKMGVFIHSVVSDIKSGNLKIELKDDAKDLLYEFVATLFLRNPVMMRLIMDFYTGVENEYYVKSVISAAEYLFEQWGWGSHEPLVSYSKKAGIFNKDIMGSPCNVEIDKISRMKYVFWYSKKGGFVTSSFPLHIISLNGNEAERIIFPVSSEIAIIFFSRQPFGLYEGMVLEPDEDIVFDNMKTYINSYTTKVARFFIANDENLLRKLC